MTSTDGDATMRDVLATDAGTDTFHEGFDPKNPVRFNRASFGWANSMFATWVQNSYVPTGKVQTDSHQKSYEKDEPSAFHKKDELALQKEEHPKLSTLYTPPKHYSSNMNTLQTRAKDEIAKETDRIRKQLIAKYGHSTEINGGKLATLWSNTFPFTAMNSWKLFEPDGTTFVNTGDIPQMWLRDSSVQMMTYLPLVQDQSENSALRQVFESVLVRQTRFIQSDRYASAFYLTHGPGKDQGPNKDECPRDPDICPTCFCRSCSPKCGPHSYQHDFELDSLGFPLWLQYKYWKMTGATNHLSTEFFDMWEHQVLPLLKDEQHHNTRSTYYYKPEKGKVRDGVGLVWSFARPSDDQTKFGYSIPENMMLVVILEQFAEIVDEVFDPSLGKGHLAEEARALAREVDAAIQKYGVVKHEGVMVYANEV